MKILDSQIWKVVWLKFKAAELQVMEMLANEKHDHPRVNKAVYHYQQRPLNPVLSWQGMKPVSSNLLRDILVSYYYFPLLLSQDISILQKPKIYYEKKELKTTISTQQLKTAPFKPWRCQRTCLHTSTDHPISYCIGFKISVLSTLQTRPSEILNS